MKDIICHFRFKPRNTEKLARLIKNLCYRTLRFSKTLKSCKLVYIDDKIRKQIPLVWHLGNGLDFSSYLTEEQAVSKWEQGTSYPEVEKLLLLSRELNVSLDNLMATEIAQEKVIEPEKVTGIITISSPHEHVVAKCYKVMS